MSNWKDLQIGQNVLMIHGFPFDSKRFNTEEVGVPLVRIRDLLTNRTETIYSGYYDPMYLIGPGDILIGMDGDFNVSKWTGGTALLNQRMLKISEKPGGNLDILFLYYVLGPLLTDINNKTSATTVKHLSTYDVYDAVIKAPALPEQRKIARILTTVDNQIEKTEALIAKYQAIKQGMMHDLFTRGIDANGHLRPPHSEAPHLYKQSALGRIPKEWEVRQLGDEIGPIVSGWSPNCDSVAADLDDWAILKTTAVVWNGYQEAENKRLPKGLKPIEALEVMQGDILITRKGPMDRVGVVVHVPKTRSLLMIPDTVLRLRLLSGRHLLPAFVPLSLASEVVQRDWFGRKIGLADAQVDINHRILKGTLFLVPSEREQKDIIDRIRLISMKLKSTQSELLKMQRVKSGLMQDLLTGKVRAKVDESARVTQ